MEIRNKFRLPSSQCPRNTEEATSTLQFCPFAGSHPRSLQQSPPPAPSQAGHSLAMPGRGRHHLSSPRRLRGDRASGFGTGAEWRDRLGETCKTKLWTGWQLPGLVKAPGTRHCLPTTLGTLTGVEMLNHSRSVALNSLKETLASLSPVPCTA